MLNRCVPLLIAATWLQVSVELTEALLEMHYYQEFRRLLQEHFGREVIRILKPSTRDEAFLGFDQGFVRSTLSASDLRSQLRAAISSQSTVSMYVGYFLQFKCAQEVSRRSRNLPAGFSAPYYRFPLSLSPSKTAGISQHETLLRLQQIAGADVSYACPMIFCQDDLHREPNLDDVRIVPLTTAPPGYSTNEQHFVCFQSMNDPNPSWCSEPVEGKSLSVTDWAHDLRSRAMPPETFLRWLQEVSATLSRLFSEQHWPYRRAIFPAAMTIVEFGESRLPVAG
jgi:hypothetical protein